MATNIFVEQRLRLDTTDQLASVVATLPVELRDTNAVPLLAILRELEASSVIELGVISAVKNLDPADPQQIAEQQTILDDYADRRLHDRDRTHCSNIRRILTQVHDHAAGPGASERVQAVDAVLAPIVGADMELLDDVESILGKARTAMAGMSSAQRVVDVERIQQEFVAELEPVRREIKASLGRLNSLTSTLIDVL